MKKLLIGLLVFGSICSYATTFETYQYPTLNNQYILSSSSTNSVCKALTGLKSSKALGTGTDHIYLNYENAIKVKKRGASSQKFKGTRVKIISYIDCTYNESDRLSTSQLFL